MNEAISDWSRGDAFSASHLNEPLPTVRSVRSIIGGGGTQVTQTPNGTTIFSPVAPTQLDYFQGIIVNAGPSGEADYTDERYWVNIANIAGGNSYDKITQTKMPKQGNPDDPEGGTSFPVILTVTNLAETSAHTHALDTSGAQYVQVFVEADNQDSPVVRYIMTCGGTSSKGQFQGDVYQMVSQNQTGWGPVVAHAKR